MDIVVINLMRLGDVAQTGPVLRRLKAVHPRSRVSLVVMDLFAEPARMLPRVDRLLTFPSHALAAALEGEAGWPRAVQEAAAWLAEAFPTPPDLVINLTPNRLAALLAFATGSRDIRGMTVDAQGELFTQPPWASYALVVSKARAANPFNLVDLFLREGGLTPDGGGLELQVPEAAAQEARRFLQGLNLAPGTVLVGLVPGASRPERSWPPRSFARAARLLLKELPCHFLIFGSQGEIPLGEAVLRDLPPGAATSLLGRTPIPLLTALLAGLDLLITNDTGPMHLAAAVGTRTLGLFLAGARVHDTGPVGPEHVVLEPHLACHPCLAPCPEPPCHQLITPPQVAALAGALVSPSSRPFLDPAVAWDTVRVYRAATDPQGYHCYLPLVRRPLELREFWRWVHRLTWGRFLDDGQESEEALLAWMRRVLKDHYAPGPESLGSETGRQSLEELIAGAERGAALAGEILALSRAGGEFPVRLWQKTEGLRSVDPVLRRLAVAFPEGAALVEFFFQEQQRVQEQEVPHLARRLISAYQRLARLGRLALAAAAETEKFRQGVPAAGEALKTAHNVHRKNADVRPQRFTMGEYHAGDHQCPTDSGRFFPPALPGGGPGGTP
uniref:Glycosyltransferase family 9 protein n=1 Tax=Desulfobacca acetoxidans TaxID=60893 RepID=A0A7V4LDA3_9BACT